MSAISGTGGDTATGRGTASQRAIEHRIAARRGHVQTRADLQREARENGIKYYYRMGVEKLEELKSRGWQTTDDDYKEFTSGGNGGEGEWAQ